MAGDAFSGTSAVGRYWQARCVGFEVRSMGGRRLGRVEKVARDEFVVGRRHRRPLRVSGNAVSVVDPWQQTLWVTTSSQTSRTSVWAQQAVQTTSAGAAQAKRLGPPARRSLAVAVARASEAPRLVPPTKRVLRWLTYRATVIGALVLWLYSVVVYAVVRVSVRVLLVVAKLGGRAGAFAYACTASATKAAIASVNSRRLSSHA